MSGELKTRIERVTVFRDRALVERIGTLSGALLTANTREATWQIGGLPLLMDDSTFRVRIDSEQMILRDVRIELEDLRDAEDDSGRGELEELQKKIGQLRETIVGRRKSIGELQQWMRITLPGPPISDGREQERPAFPVETGQAYVDYLADMLRSRQEQVRKLSGELVVLEREQKTKLEIIEYRQPAEVDDPARRWGKSAIVRVALADSVSEAGDAELIASYCIEGARWAPSYALHYSDGARKATLVYSVAVSQGTGEDWSGAQLGFSAADLKREVQLAELPSRRIGRAQPPKASSLRPAPQPADEMFASFENWLEKTDEPDWEQAEDLQQELQEKAEELYESGKKVLTLQEGLEDKSLLKKKGRSGARFRGTTAALPPPQAPPPPSPARRAPGIITPSVQPSLTDSFNIADLPASEPEPLMEMSADEFEGDFEEGAAKSFAKVGRKSKSKSAGGRPDTVEFGKEREESAAEIVGEVALDSSVPAINYRAFRMAGPEDYERGKLVPAAAQAGWDDGAAEAFDDAREKSWEIESPGDRLSSSYFQIYRASGPADIPSDGGVHTVEIQTEEGDAEIDYRCAPVVDSQVFRRMKFSSPFDFVLPPGKSAVYLDGGFAFNTKISVSGKGEARIPLGVEQRLKVSRNARYSEHESGIISSEAELTHNISIEVASSLDCTVELEIVDRIPSPGVNQKDIKIEELPGEVKGEKLETYEGHRLEGGRKFTLEVLSGKTAKLDFGYCISIPAKMEISGGNRRE
jgi:Domain of unknown function (DUF4139)/N-terminal domain of unknown function (DUF4140)